MPKRDGAAADGDCMPLTASSLRMEAARRADTNHNSYRVLYAQVHRALREHVRNHPKVHFLLWKVPPYVYGRPLYNHAHAIRYVSEKLMHGNFKVSLAQGTDDTLLIDWTPRPVPRLPAAVRADILHARREKELAKTARERHASSRRTKRETKLSEAASGSMAARQAAENLNSHLEKLLASLS